MKKKYTVATALAEIESVPFECEAGHLKNFTAWQFIKEHLTEKK